MKNPITDFTLEHPLNSLAQRVHQANRKWWTNLETGEYPIERNFGELIALVHSELSEALEGHRKNLRPTAWCPRQAALRGLEEKK